MAYFKLLNKIFPKSPDLYLKKSTDAEAALARMAHLNSIIDNLNDIGHYELNVQSTLTLAVNTSKGIIDITNFNKVMSAPNFGGWVTITLTNSPILNVANRDNLYLQVTPYYSKLPNDDFIPYLLPAGFLDGLNIKIYDAWPNAQAGDHGEGAFYIYYEIKYIG